MNIGNNYLYIIGVKCSLQDLSETISMVDGHVCYFDFWKNICFFEYNKDTCEYLLKEIENGEVHYHTFDNEKELFRHMRENKINFIADDNPLGEIFVSYSGAYLALIRWVGDIAYTKEKLNQLVEG